MQNNSKYNCQQGYCYPKPKLRGYRKSKYPQSGLDSSQLMNIKQNERRENDRTYWNKTNLAFYQNGLDLMNVTANYNFTYWDGYRWKRNKNSLRPPRSTPWTTYPCDNCVILPGLKYRECNPIPYVPCPSPVGEAAMTDPDPKCYATCRDSKCCPYRCCGPTEPIPKCPSQLLSQKDYENQGCRKPRIICSSAEIPDN